MTPAPRRRARRGTGEQLRGEILAAARDLLARTGDMDAVSIRAVADVVGVTPPSIYLHFADKDALIEAVVVEMFGDLAERMAAAGTHEHPLERLCQQGMAYIQFALDAPEHYRIATMSPQHTIGPMDVVLQSAAFGQQTALVEKCMDIGIYQRGDPTPIVLELWAAAHGIASLLIAKPYLWGDDPLGVAYRVLGAASVGRAVLGYLGLDARPTDFVNWFTTLPPSSAQ